MKKTFSFLLVFSFSFIYCYSQLKNVNETIQIKKELIDSLDILKRHMHVLENKLVVSDSVYNSNFKVLSQSLDSTKKSIDDTRLRESLKSAESTLNKQNYWIESYGVIYSVITIVLAILPFLLYFIQIRPLIQSARETSNNANQANRDANQANRDANQANRDVNIAVKTLNTRITELDNRIELKLKEKLDKFTELRKTQRIDQVINDLICPNSFLRDQANYRLNTYNKDELNEEQIYKLFDILNKYVEKSIEEAIIYFLTKEN